MKILVKVKFNEEESVEEFLRIFSIEFDSESNKVEIYFKDRPPMKIIEAICHCNVVEFDLDKTQEEHSEENTLGQTEQTATKEEIPAEVKYGTHPKRVKMACMPEIPLFEEVLGSADKTLPIDERVRLVLVAMGLETLRPREKQEVFEISNLAVRLKNMRLFMVRDIMYERTSIPPMYDWDEAVMVFSTFLNKFVRKHVRSEEIKVEVFLRDLQKVILDESEIQSFDDFIQSIRK